MGTLVACGPSVECWHLRAQPLSVQACPRAILSKRNRCSMRFAVIVMSHDEICSARHDMGWSERKIFGKIRYMCLCQQLSCSLLKFFLCSLLSTSTALAIEVTTTGRNYEGCKRKFNVKDAMGHIA